MKVIRNSKSDILNKFEEFTDSICGCDYSVSIEACSFTHLGSGTITKEFINSLFPQYIMIGDIEKTNLNNFKELLLKNISYCGSDQGVIPPGKILNVIDQETAIERNNEFWSIVSNYLQLPPSEVFLYHPQKGGYFYDYVIWVLCFVLINEETKTGIFVCMSASD